jgi:hypothetical protein
MKVYHDFKQTMVEPNIWEAFQAIGFEFDTEAEPYHLLFNEEKWRFPIVVVDWLAPGSTVESEAEFQI